VFSFYTERTRPPGGENGGTEAAFRKAKNWPGREKGDVYLDWERLRAPHAVLGAGRPVASEGNGGLH